jgi:biopolymer transport protein ExbB/TolQ
VVLLVIVAIIVAIFVIVGLVFGSVLAFLVINKITKRHLDLLQRKMDTKNLVVANLDDVEEMKLAEEMSDSDYDEIVKEHQEQREEESEEEDMIKKEKAGSY